jgi:predicted CopG family antitoxin
MSGIPDIYRLYNCYNNSLKKSSNRLTTIAVSKENYLALKRLGSAGDSFNDVVTEVIKQLKTPLQIGQTSPKRRARNEQSQKLAEVSNSK